MERAGDLICSGACQKCAHRVDKVGAADVKTKPYHCPHSVPHNYRKDCVIGRLTQDVFKRKWCKTGWRQVKCEYVESDK
jgi:hypothetical protein